MRSMRVISRSGRMIASTIPGRPAPEPKSMTLASQGNAVLITAQLSTWRSQRRGRSPGPRSPCSMPVPASSSTYLDARPSLLPKRSMAGGGAEGTAMLMSVRFVAAGAQCGPHRTAGSGAHGALRVLQTSRAPGTTTKREVSDALTVHMRGRYLLTARAPRPITVSRETPTLSPGLPGTAHAVWRLALVSPLLSGVWHLASRLRVWRLASGIWPLSRVWRLGASRLAAGVWRLALALVTCFVAAISTDAPRAAAAWREPLTHVR